MLNLVSCVTLKFDVWPWKIIGHLFYATSSFVHHFIAIHEFKMELQSRNAKFGSKSVIFLSCVTLAFDLWHWPFAWISLLSLIITPENFMIRRREHSEKGVTNGRTERSVLRAAWSQLKNTRFKHDITLKDMGKTYWYQTTTLAFGSFHGIGCHFCECDSPSNYCKCEILASFNPVFKKIEPLMSISILPIGKCVTRCSC